MCIRNKNTVIIYMAVLEFNLYVVFFLLAIGYPVHS